VNNFYSAGRALHEGRDPNLTASAMAAYLQQGIRVYQANMRVNGDAQTGVDAWNKLSPSHQNALLVQFYKQGPAPERVLRSMTLAARYGAPYVPQIGLDGAGATYVANEAAFAQALVGAPADFSSRWDALGPSSPRTTGAPDNQAAPAPPPGSDPPQGIVSGKPIRFLGAPIFDTRMPAKPMEDPQGPLSLNDAYLEYLKRLNAGQVH
jgi:hypothetical protein